MHTHTGTVRTGLCWLASNEKSVVHKLTAAHFPAPSHRSSRGSSVTHIHTQTHWLSHPIVLLLQQACSMSPQYDTCTSTLARLHSDTHSHLAPRGKIISIKLTHLHTHMHIWEIFCVYKKSKKKVVRGLYPHRQKYYPKEVKWLHLHGRLWNRITQSDLCVTDCCTYVLVHNISLITDTQPLHHDKDWARTQEWAIRDPC